MKATTRSKWKCVSEHGRDTSKSDRRLCVCLLFSILSNNGNAHAKSQSKTSQSVRLLVIFYGVFDSDLLMMFFELWHIRTTHWVSFDPATRAYACMNYRKCFLNSLLIQMKCRNEQLQASAATIFQLHGSRLIFQLHVLKYCCYCDCAYEMLMWILCANRITCLLLAASPKTKLASPNDL